MTPRYTAELALVVTFLREPDSDEADRFAAELARLITTGDLADAGLGWPPALRADVEGWETRR